jgi:hypothetical protein
MVTRRARAAAVTALISIMVLIVPASAAAFSNPPSLSRHAAGSPAHVALPSTPAVTTAVTSSPPSRSVEMAA